MDALEAESTEQLNKKLCGATPDKPIFLFITGSDPDTMKVLSVVQQSTLRAEPVALGAKFFKLIRITHDSVGRNHPLAKKIGGKKLPRIILITRDGRKSKKLEGKISASKLFKAMKSIVKADSKGDLNGFVSKMRKILTKLDQLSTEKSKWQHKFGKVMAEGGNGKKVKLAKKASAAIDAQAASIKKEMEELQRKTAPKVEMKTAKS